mgnify:CR=1 FL=1
MKQTKHKKACHFATDFHTHRIAIPVELIELEDSSYHLLVKVDADGIAGDMIIDTGASVTVADRKLFPERTNDDDAISMQSGSVSGQISNVRLIQVKRLTIGGRRLRNFRLAGIDLDYVNEMYNTHLKRKIIGLLGCDFCVRYKVCIDYSKKELILNL